MAIRKRRMQRDEDERDAVHAPEWTSGNDHDPGVTIVALFAFLGATLLWSSGRRDGAAARLPRLFGVGLGAASALWLLRRRHRRRPPCAREQSS